ncbi:LPD7 domain-containing protein [Phenylobacterium sp. CCH12-B4]|uniref:LPD7 domain-containing protein n=2 Tax=unclassified Phenylobacterium TaxID=2640670 RepID=UPI00083B223C|nr:LPD7 domain-containing protein [Phenylobacterium sp. CCH12-B4]
MADETDAGAEPTPAPPPPQTATASRSEPRKRPEDEDRDPAENSISPVLERAAERDASEKTQRTSADASKPSPQPANENQPERFSVERGDVPDAVKRRYYSEEPQFSAELRFFTDARSDRPAFRDAGGKLTARDNHLDVVRDLVAIAEHRGWKAIEVRGEEDFRRAVWLEARTVGLEVRGYKPAERDLQELARRQDARDVNTIAPARNTARAADGSPDQTRTAAEAAGAAAKPARIDYDQGVTGKLLESGEAPYKHRSGQELTPFVRVEQKNGRQIEVWGVGLPAALQRSGAQVGDEITLRRDGVERVSRTFEVRDKQTGEISLQQRQVPRNRWTIEAERFRVATPAEAARDPALRDAQSRLAVVAAIVKDRHPDPAMQERLIAGAKEKIAAHIEQGGRFAPAQVREPVVDKGRPSPEQAPAVEAARAVRPESAKSGPERTRSR